MPTQNENALDILKKRSARGEITKEDFDRMKRDIS
ncbi:MAG: SHOCT domain-containing protein [Smithellaceae bacterium]